MVLTRVANYCSILKLAQKLKKKEISLPLLEINSVISRAFLREGLIRGFVVKEHEKRLTIQLKYGVNGAPLLRDIRVLSGVRRPVTITYRELKKFLGGVVFLSTSRGILSKGEALYYREGGYLLCQIFI